MYNTLIDEHVQVKFESPCTCDKKIYKNFTMIQQHDYMDIICNNHYYTTKQSFNLINHN